MTYNRILSLPLHSLQLRRKITLCNPFHTSFFSSPLYTSTSTLLRNLTPRFFSSQTSLSIDRTHNNHEFFRKRVTNFHTPNDFLNEENVETDLRDEMVKSESDVLGIFEGEYSHLLEGTLLPRDKLSTQHLKLRSVSELENIQRRFGDGLVAEPKPIDFVQLFSLCYYLNDFESVKKGLKFAHDHSVHSPFVYEFIFRICYKMGEFQFGEELFFQLPKNMISDNALPTIALILGERGNVRPIQDMMANKEPGPYFISALILGYLKIGRKDFALKTLNSHDLGGSILPYNVLLSELVKMGDVEEISLVLEKMDEMGIQPNVITISILIQSNLKNRNYDSVLSLIETLDPSQFYNDEFNTILSVIIDYPDIMIKVVDIFVMKGMTLNFEGFLSLIKSLCSVGEVDTSIEYLEEMINQNIPLFPEVFKIIVRGCVSAKNITRALEVCELCGNVLGVYEKGRLLYSLYEYAKQNLSHTEAKAIKNKIGLAFNLEQRLPSLSPSAHLLYERISDKIKDQITQQKDSEFLEVTEIVTRIMEPIKFQISESLFQEHHPKYPKYYEIFAGALFKILCISVMRRATHEFYVNSLTRGLPIDEFLLSNVLHIKQQTVLQVTVVLKWMLNTYEEAIPQFNITPTSHTITPMLKAFIAASQPHGLISFFDTEVAKYGITPTLTMYILYYHAKLTVTHLLDLDTLIAEMRLKMTGSDYAKRCLYQMLARFTYKRKYTMETIFSHIVQFLREDQIVPFEKNYQLLLHYYYANQNYVVLQELFDMGKKWIENGLVYAGKLFNPKIYLRILRSYEEQNNLEKFLEAFNEMGHYKLTFLPSHLDVFCKFFIRLGRLEEAVTFLRSIDVNTCKISTTSYCRVIRAYGENKDLLSAEMYFELGQKNLLNFSTTGEFSYNDVDRLHSAMIDAYAENNLATATEFFMNTHLLEKMGSESLHALLDHLLSLWTKSEEDFQHLVKIWPQVIEKAERRGNVLFVGERATFGATLAKHILAIERRRDPEEIKLFLDRWDYLQTLDDDYWQLSLSVVKFCGDVRMGVDGLRDPIKKMEDEKKMLEKEEKMERKKKYIVHNKRSKEKLFQSVTEG
eukprot:TRINITY_DN6301_c0_g3_i1.p1 TRINITY_DN6301_c0_g3~~TRINITY_DN6301_c0_g3_i1.p1  ORF type:complete len:1088 (-),score=173.17 TRINITY_DN6301_c0_g3_i1:26-3289(-)